MSPGNGDETEEVGELEGVDGGRHRRRRNDDRLDDGSDDNNFSSKMQMEKASTIAQLQKTESSCSPTGSSK